MQRSDSGIGSGGVFGSAGKQGGAVQDWWLRQSRDEPLFPDLLWSRPENRRHAGKLLIVGGNSTSFAAPSAAFTAAAKAGIGTARVVLPQSLEKILAKMFPESEFLPVTPSGSFARTALGPLSDAASWSDGTLLAGDFGKNSETAILLENFITKYADNLTLGGDSLDYFLNEPDLIIDRPDTIIVGEFSKLQKLLSGRLLLKHSMNLAQVVEQLTKLAGNCPSGVVTAHSDQIIVAIGGQLSTTPAADVDLGQLAAFVSVWQLQQPGKPFEALTTAVIDYFGGL